MPDTIKIGTIATQQPNAPFTVTGTLAATPAMTFADDGGADKALPTGATIPSLSGKFSFTHPGLAIGAHTVLIRDSMSGASASVAVTVQAAPQATFISAGSGSFIANGVAYSVTAAGVAMGSVGGTNKPLAGGSGTSAMGFVGGLVYGQDAASGQWYTWDGSSWTQSATPAGAPSGPGTGGGTGSGGGSGGGTSGGGSGGGGTGTATGIMQSTGGKLIAGDGSTFISQGIAVMDAQIQKISPAQIKQKFPKCNAIRLSIGNSGSGFQNPAFDWPTTSNWINAAIAAGMFVIIDDHEQNGGTNPYTGSALTRDLAYAVQAANTYKSRADAVAFQSMNEPGNTNGLAAYHKAFHDAVRGTGAKNLVLHDVVGGNLPQANGPSDSKTPYQSMTNWAWDFHLYNWMTNGNANQSQVNSWVDQQVGILQNWVKMANGDTPAAWCGEWGWLNYTGDPNVEVNGGAGTNQIAVCALQHNLLNGGKHCGGAVWLLTGEIYGWPTSSDLLSGNYASITQHGSVWNANA